MTTTKKPKNTELEILLKKHKTRESLGLEFLQNQKTFAEYENKYWESTTETEKKISDLSEQVQNLEIYNKEYERKYTHNRKYAEKLLAENKEFEAALEKERALVFDAQGKARDLSQDVDRLQELANKRGADNSNLNRSIHAEREKVKALEADKKDLLQSYWAEKNKVANLQDSLKATEDAAVEALEELEKIAAAKNTELQAYKTSCLNLNKTWSERLKKSDERYSRLEHKTEVLRENRDEWQVDYQRLDKEYVKVKEELRKLKNPQDSAGEYQQRISINGGPWQVSPKIESSFQPVQPLQVDFPSIYKKHFYIALCIIIALVGGLAILLVTR